MKITIDLHQSPVALMNELTQAVRIALGPRHFIDVAEGDDDVPNFTAEELADPKINVVPSASVALTPITSGVTALPAASSSVETDVEGQPWDSDIHSAGKSKIANGTWKLKKGMSEKPEYVAQIKARNKALMGAKLPEPLAVVASLPALAPVVAALPELPPVAQVPGPDVEINVVDYTSFAAYVAQQLAVKPNTTKTNLDTGLKHYGIVDAAGEPDLTAVAHRPEVVATLYPWLKAVIALGQD